MRLHQALLRLHSVSTFGSAEVKAMHVGWENAIKADFSYWMNGVYDKEMSSDYKLDSFEFVTRKHQKKIMARGLVVVDKIVFYFIHHEKPNKTYRIEYYPALGRGFLLTSSNVKRHFELMIFTTLFNSLDWDVNDMRLEVK